MSTILEKAETRLAPANAQAQQTKIDMVDAMRNEIGYAHYEQAKVKLPEIEQAIRTIYAPFLNRVGTLQAQSRAPLPTSVLGWLKEIGDMCHNTANAIRRGIAEWDGLTPPLWKDGKRLDVVVRPAVIQSIRDGLRNWDGKLTCLNDRKGWVERYIDESGWPAAQPSTGALATRPHREAEPIPVESDFLDGPKLS